MKARIYQTTQGYDVVTHEGTLYQLVKAGKSYVQKKCGKVGDNYSVGVLLKKIPDPIKTIFFTLNKST